MAARVRIEEVAALAGVSMKTVSRVLNREPNVREDTRLKVQTAVDKLNYKPHPSARSLAGHKSYLLALLYDNPSANYLVEVMRGVLAACETVHYNMMMCPLDFESANFIDAIETMVSHSQPDGLVLTPPITDSPALLKRLTELGIPYASISPRKQTGCIGVAMDETHASKEMMQHLVELGHRRIAHICGHSAHGASGWRLSGYRAGLKQAGLAFDSTLVVRGEFSFESGMRAANQLLDLPEPPTAVFAANDDMAAGVMRVAMERGLRVPEDLSVCGFDDTPMSQQIFPPLTTVHQPSGEMGKLAALELLGAIHKRQPGRMLSVPYTLQLRRSTAPRR